MKSAYKILAGLAISASLAAMPTMSAMATPINVTGMGFASPTTVHINANNPSSALHVYAGGFQTTNGNNQLLTWCVDILKGTYFNNPYNDSQLVSGDSIAYIGQQRADALTRLATEALGQVNNGVTSGAFQLAIWEIIYENSNNAYSLNTGNFTAFGASDASIALANTWLSNLPGSSTYSLNVFLSPTRQNLGLFSSIPEPSTLGLFALGLLALSFTRRKTTS